MTASHRNAAGNPHPPKRGKATGWSEAAGRRCTAFLRSVDETTLHTDAAGSPLAGVAVTLTLRDLPPTPDAWAALQRAWMERQRRRGLYRIHWVMEMQRRGVPHLHAAAWYRWDGTTRHGLELLACPLLDWAGSNGVAVKYGAGMRAQQARPITGSVGWFRYLAKHAGRSRWHYQRQREAMPDAWESSPRVWGKRGDWVTIDPTDHELTRADFWRLRRLVRAARLAEARRGLPLNRRQVSALRRMLKCRDRRSSEVHPVSEWMPEVQQQRLIAAARTIRAPV